MRSVQFVYVHNFGKFPGKVISVQIKGETGVADYCSTLQATGNEALSTQITNKTQLHQSTAFVLTGIP